MAHWWVMTLSAKLTGEISLDNLLLVREHCCSITITIVQHGAGVPTALESPQRNGLDGEAQGAPPSSG